MRLCLLMSPWSGQTCSSVHRSRRLPGCTSSLSRISRLVLPLFTPDPSKFILLSLINSPNKLLAILLMDAKLSTGLAKACPVMPFHISVLNVESWKTQLTRDNVWRMADDSWLVHCPFCLEKKLELKGGRTTKELPYLVSHTCHLFLLSLLTTTLGKIFSEHSGCSHCTPDSDALRAATAPLYTLQICSMRTEIPRKESLKQESRTAEDSTFKKIPGPL